MFLFQTVVETKISNLQEFAEPVEPTVEFN